MIFNGSKLRALREAKLWSKSDLAKRVGVAAPQIGRWESMEATPRGAAIKRLSKVLGVAVSELIEEEVTA